jgi:hypothetical protein
VKLVVLSSGQIAFANKFSSLVRFEVDPGWVGPDIWMNHWKWIVTILAG